MAEALWPLLDERRWWPLVAARDAVAARRIAAVACASAVVALSYALAAAPGMWLLHHAVGPDLAPLAPTLGVPWLPVGIAVAGLLLFGPRASPGVFLGSCLTWGVLQGDPWISVLVDGAGEAASVVLIAWMLRHWGYRPSLARYQDALLLLGAAALGRMVSSAIDVIATFAVAWRFSTPDAREVLEAAGVYRQGGVFYVHSSLFASNVRWWANSVAGIVLVVPLLAALARGPRTPTGRRAELAVWSMLIAGWLAFAALSPSQAPRVVLLAAALALVVYAAQRFGVSVASGATLLFSGVATAGFALQFGMFAGIGGRERMEVAWGFIGVLVGAGLFLTPLLAGRDEAQRRLAASVERYRRLFFANPSPMWAEEPATGRILLANDAALRAYGYTEEAFLRLHGRDLIAPGAAPPALSSPYETTHRSASGSDLQVEVTPVTIELEGASLRVCFVDMMGERSDLKLAMLSAADLERHRLGQEIRDGLGPILARLAARIEELATAATCNEPLDLGLTIAAEEDATAAALKCRQLNRGASPIHFASGDLLAALRRIPEELATDSGPELTVSIWAHAPVELSLERCEHLYRIAHDAVRAALLRPGARRVELAVDVTADRLSLSVDDDGAPAARATRREALELWPLDVRAAAAHAQLSIGTRHGGGNRVRCDCSQTTEALPPSPEERAGHGVPGVLAAVEEPAAPRARASYGSALRTLVDGASLFLAVFAAGAVGISFLQLIDPHHVALQPAAAIPWIASGFAAAGLLIGGERLAPAVFLGTVGVWHGLYHDPWITVLFDGVGETLAAVLVARLLTRFGFRRAFNRFRDLLLLVVVAAASRVVPAAFDALGLHVAGALAPASLTPELREGLSSLGPRTAGLSPIELAGYAAWWVNGVAGVVLVVPAVVPVSEELRAVIRRHRLEAALFACGVLTVLIAIAGGPPASWRLPILGLAVVLVAWGALQFGVAAASTATLLFSLAASVGFGFGLGPIAARPGEGTEVLWGFIGLLGTTGLFLTTVVAEHELTMRGLKSIKARYETLFEAIPWPLFAFTPPAGRITMVNAAAIRRYGYDRGQFLTMTPAMLAVDAQPAAEARTTAGDREIQACQHRTRTGERFDVELWVTRVDGGEEVENLCYAIDVTERDDLRRRVLEASDRERRRLAQELHDSLGQSLTGLQLGVSSVRRTLERDGSARKDVVQFMAGAIREAISLARQIVQGVSPLHATDGDLVAALERLPLELPPADRARLSVEVRCESALRLPLVMREHLYQIAREAVNNALKHADATQIVVTMLARMDSIRLAVEDDGRGFDPAARRSAGLGLRSLVLRAGALRGRLAIERRAPHGTAIVCQCPQGAA